MTIQRESERATAGFVAFTGEQEAEIAIWKRARLFRCSDERMDRFVDRDGMHYFAVLLSSIDGKDIYGILTFSDKRGTGESQIRIPVRMADIRLVSQYGRVLQDIVKKNETVLGNKNEAEIFQALGVAQGYVQEEDGFSHDVYFGRLELPGHNEEGVVIERNYTRRTQSEYFGDLGVRACVSAMALGKHLGINIRPYEQQL